MVWGVAVAWCLCGLICLNLGFGVGLILGLDVVVLFA